MRTGWISPASAMSSSVRVDIESRSAASFRVRRASGPSGASLRRRAVTSSRRDFTSLRRPPMSSWSSSLTLFSACEAGFSRSSFGSFIAGVDLRRSRPASARLVDVHVTSFFVRTETEKGHPRAGKRVPLSACTTAGRRLIQCLHPGPDPLRPLSRFASREVKIFQNILEGPTSLRSRHLRHNIINRRSKLLRRSNREK